VTLVFVIFRLVIPFILKRSEYTDETRNHNNERTREGRIFTDNILCRTGPDNKDLDIACPLEAYIGHTVR
jgi:hypothetical protein